MSISTLETDRVSDCHPNLVTTLSSRMILDNINIEVTLDSKHHTGKNGGHFYGDNWHSTTKNVENSVCHSNLVTTPSSSINLTSQSVPHKDPMKHVGKNGEHFYGENWHNTTKNGENSDCNSNPVTKDLKYHAGRNGEYSCMKNSHGDDLYQYNINKHSCTHQNLPDHQASKMHEYLTKRHIKSYQHMETLMHSPTM